MYVEVDLRAASPVVTLRESEDFNAFTLVVVGSAYPLDEALEHLSHLADSEHAFLKPDAVRALAGGLAGDAAWREAFDAMMGYAATKGWADDAGNVRAHIERGPPL